MSEHINFNHENNEVPTRDEVLSAFVDKRELLQSQLDELDAKPGFKKDATDMIYEKRDRQELTSQLEGLNEEWYALGGEAIEEANVAKDALNFKSDALDHVRVNAQVRDAKDAFYEKFLASEEIAAMEAEDAAQQDMLGSMPAATKDPTNVMSNAEAKAAQTDGQKAFVGQLEEAIASRLAEQYLNNAQPAASESSPEGVDSTESQAATNEPERQLTARERGERFRQRLNPVYWLTRMQARRAVGLEGEGADDTQEKHGTRRSRVFAAVGAGAIAAVGLYTASKFGAHLPGLGGGNAHGQAADLLPSAPSGNHHHAAEAAAAHVPTNGGATHEHAAQTLSMHKGEGWNEVMQDAGLPERSWGSVLHKAGPELVKHGYAYKMDASMGDYGMLMNHSHKVPAGAMKILARYAAKDGYDIAA